MNTSFFQTKAIDLGKLVVQMTTRAGAGHPSSSLSLSHIVAVLMYGKMRFDPANPWDPRSDRLVLSEGHAVPIVYAAYADLGGVVGHDLEHCYRLKREEVDGLRTFSSVLDGHPNPAAGFPFFDAATGSLGMGLSIAAGLAKAARLDHHDRRIFCIVGDGESREGQIAEAMDFIVDHNLTNVCAIFNCNGEGQANHVSPQQSAEVLHQKLAAYGWDSCIIDGHDPEQILHALSQFETAHKPYAIVAKTIKGWGVSSLQGGNFHGKPLSADKLPAAYASLDRMAAEVEAQSRSPIEGLGRSTGKDNGSSIRIRDSITLPEVVGVLESAGLAEALQKKRLSTRRAYGAALSALGGVNPEVVVLDGDVSNSTFADYFAGRYPDRFVECKIAEQNMISVAVGLAAGGKIPFANSFGKFIVRAYDQVELAMISRANVKLVGSHVGLGPASDGPSQMALVDVAFFRSLTGVADEQGRPVCHIFQPADAVAAIRLTEHMANLRRLCYMRTHRPDVPFIYDTRESFEVGECKVLRKGTALTLVAGGVMVHEALNACRLLEQQGISCALVDAYCLPMNFETLWRCADQTHRQILVVEDNYMGGWGSAIAEAAAQSGLYRVESVHLQRIPKSARTPEELMEHYGLSATHIVDQVKKLL